MLKLLARRGRAQWPLLACLLAILTLGGTLLGTCTLLATRTSERAVEVAASRADPDDLQVTAYTVTVSAANTRSVADDTRALLTSSLAPFTATTTTRASSVMHTLPMATDLNRGLLSEAYLSGVENLRAQSTLVAGRWPQAARSGAPVEAALFENTARLLGLKVGNRVHIGPAVGLNPAQPLDLTVVGLVHPLPDAAWDRDPLGGAGFDPHPADARYAAQVNAYGPFLVDLGALLGSGSTLDRLEVTARPDLSAPTGHDLDRITDALLSLDRRLTGTLGVRVQFDRVFSPIPQTLLDGRSEQELIAGSVLAIALIGILLTAIALALAGRLATGVRAEEGALLASLGTSRGQFALVAAAEAAVLAVLAAAISIPASSALHAALTHLSPLASAGLATRPAVTAAQVLAVGCGALALAILHVGLAVLATGETSNRASAVRPGTNNGDRPRRRELLARSGADVLLCALAVVGWWQLRAQPAAAGSRADAVRVLAPALILAASAALALRLLPPALRRAERLAGATRGLVLPLAAFQAARRPQAFAAGLLIALACAAATFGLAFGATWTASQHDQADLSVGTDLAVSLTNPPMVGQSTAVDVATGGVISPVAVQNVAAGSWLGGPGAAPQLIALDTRKAPSLLRGRTDGGHSWRDMVKSLEPTTAVTGPALPRGATPTFTGTATGEAPIVVTPRLLLQDETGLRTACSGPPVPLDGRPHPARGCAPVAGLRLVAVALPVTGDSQALVSTIDVTMTLPGGLDSPTSWTTHAASPEGQLAELAVSTAGSRLRVSATVQFSNPSNLSRVVVATAFPDPSPVPVAISTSLAQNVNARPGSKLSLTLDSTPVDAVVTEIVPMIPSAPGAAAAMADVDTLSRALVVHGDLDSPVTAWWVGNPRVGALASVDKLHLGDVTTRTGEATRLTDGPLRASFPAMLRVLVAAAVLLLFGGVVLHVAYDVQLRALEVARLRGLGLSRRDIRSALLGEHAAILLPLLLAGTVIGAAATWVLTPLLIRSDTGAVPVPPAVVGWPWATETALLALLVAGAGLAVAAVVTAQARRADSAHLRVAS